MRTCLVFVAVACGVLLANGRNLDDARSFAPRVDALESSAWECSQWLSVRDAPFFTGVVGNGARASDGTSWFVAVITNEEDVVSAKWMTAGLGVYEIYVNGCPVGDDFLKPGFTHNRKTKYSFTYDVTKLLNGGKGESNVFAAEVSAGWWRDKVCTPANESDGFVGRKSAFRGVLEFTGRNGSRRRCGTNTEEWRAGIAGPVVQAGIFDGETCDARLKPGYGCIAALNVPEVNYEFKGEILPTHGAEIFLRTDRAMEPVEAYVWRDIAGSVGTNEFGTVVKARRYKAGEILKIGPGENLVVDFGQNCAAVPFFEFKAVAGTVLTVLPAEMLNDRNGAVARGNDGPEGSVYRVNLRAGYENGRLIRYSFAGKEEGETYHPRFSYFGFRYLSLGATDAVEVRSLRCVPVSSIGREMELGKLETGSADINRLIANVYWGQLSNYLSVPTDCPQRNERLGWTADTQVFSEAASFNADVYAFLRKWMRDMRDSQLDNGSYPSVAPFAQYGNEGDRFGWADAGVIVPYTMWKQFGDTAIIAENWASMEKFLGRMCETKGATLPGKGQYADWLSFERFQPCNADWRGNPPKEALFYWDYLGACYWLWDARLMSEMASATGRAADAVRYAGIANEAKAHILGRFVGADGLLSPVFRNLQTACLFALKFDLVEGEARKAVAAILRRSIADHDGCNMTGFLGTSILMDTLTENGMADVAYALLFNRKFPSWLYSVDQGATTIWERWNSYTKEKGFGPVSMNSFNHYAYGAVLAWIYKTAAGIAADPKNPGFRNIIMAPKPDRRLGFVKAEYKSAAGLIRSHWHYDGDIWVWEFTIPDGATADVTLSGESAARRYGSGTHVIRQ